jgi:SHS2 domain-containing protein
MTETYELLEHTADMGVRARAATLAGLIRPCTAGLYAVIGQLVPTGDAQPWQFEAVGDDIALLLRDYLGEVLALFAADGQLIEIREVPEFSPQRLTVLGLRRPIDPGRSIVQREAKAVTYHELSVREVPGGYEAVFIVDI